MIQRDSTFYDVIAYGLNGTSFQEFVDRFDKLKYNVLNTDGFNWDPEIQIDFTYEQLQAQLGIATLPTYVDIYSRGPLKSQKGLTIGTNKIPRFKHGFAIDEKIIREKMIMYQRFGQAALNPQTKEALMELLFDNVEKLLQGNRNALTYQRMQVVSTGQYSITTDNNPQGISGLTFDFGIPAANKQTLTGNARWWTNASHTTAVEGSASDPIKFLQEKYKEATVKCPAGHFEISKQLWDDFLVHSMVRQRVGYNLSPLVTSDTVAQQVAYNLDDDKMKNSIERLVGCRIVVRDTMAVVEKFNKTTKEIEEVSLPGFNIKNVTFVPNGKLGTIKAVEPIAVPDPGARIAFYDGGRTILKQMFNTKTNTQEIESECTALVVPSTAHYIRVYTVTV